MEKKIAISIKTKVLMPTLLLTAMMTLFVMSSWLVVKETDEINHALAHRFHEIEEVREIEVLVSSLVHPLLEYVSTFNEEDKKEVDVTFHKLDNILDELNEMEVVTEKERKLIGYLAKEINEIKMLSELLFKEAGSITPKNSISLINRISREHVSIVSQRLIEWHEHEAEEVNEKSEESEHLLSVYLNWITVFAAVIVLMFLFSLWLNNNVLIKPIVSLSKSANLFAAGKLKEKTRIYSEDELGGLAADINQMAMSLDDMYSRLAMMAMTDQLTGLMNRHGFADVEHKETSRAKRYGHPLTLVMVDIDNFKAVNDTYGHSVGDKVINAIASICSDMFRDCDHCFRYGGEEFVVLMPQTSVTDALVAVERFRKAVEENQITTEGHTLNVTVSTGLAQYDKEEPEGQLLKNADQALYEAKEKGRNRTVSYLEITKA